MRGSIERTKRVYVEEALHLDKVPLVLLRLLLVLIVCES